MNILVTGARFFPSIALIRAFHDGGLRVDVADALPIAPGLHSHAADKTHHVASPAEETLKFVADVATIVRERDIDMIVAPFEDSFFLSRFADEIPAPIFVPPFATVAELHNKATFQDVCHRLGLPAPRTIVAKSRDVLREAVPQFGDFVARPAFSRGGYNYLTNHGPRAGETTVDDCNPTEDNPWLVQEYIDGNDACSFSIVRDGKIVVHAVYEPTIAAEGGFSVQFSSIEDFGTLEMTAKVAAEFGYNGFIGFDVRRTGDGFVMIECNPRLTAGCFLTPEDWLTDAVTGQPSDLRIAPPGVRRQYDAIILERRETHLSPRQMLHELLTTRDVTLTAEDVLPTLYTFINRRHWSRLAEREHVGVADIIYKDIAWDGTPMPEPGTQPSG